MTRNVSNDQIPDGWSYDLLDSFTTRCSGHTSINSKPPNYRTGCGSCAFRTLPLKSFPISFLSLSATRLPQTKPAKNCISF